MIVDLIEEIEKGERCGKLIDFNTGTLSIKRIVNSHILKYVYTVKLF